MQEIEIIKENPLTLPEIKEKLSKIEKENLGFRAKKTLEYLKVFGKTKLEKIKEKKKKLEELNIGRMKEKTMTKLIDINPQDEDSIKVVLTSDNITLKKEDIQRILEAIK